MANSIFVKKKKFGGVLGRARQILIDNITGIKYEGSPCTNVEDALAGLNSDLSELETKSNTIKAVTDKLASFVQKIHYTAGNKTFELIPDGTDQAFFIFGRAYNNKNVACVASKFNGANWYITNLGSTNIATLSVSGNVFTCSDAYCYVCVLSTVNFTLRAPS